MKESVSARLIERDHATVAATIYRYTDIAFQRGEGVYLYDFEGHKYLDFVAVLATWAIWSLMWSC
jgi:4-aminobutyrate aminotransferase-like enzyme